MSLLKIDQVYWSYIVIFSDRETSTNLFLLDMLNFDVILGMDSYLFII